MKKKNQLVDDMRKVLEKTYKEYQQPPNNLRLVGSDAQLESAVALIVCIVIAIGFVLAVIIAKIQGAI